MKIFKTFRHYWNATSSAGFLARFISANLYNYIPLGLLRPSSRKSSNRYVFNTSFGTFLADTTFGWYVLGPSYESNIRRFIDKNAKEFARDKDRIFIDVGAHIGRYAVELAKNYDYKVLAFEPSPDSFRLLKINTLLSEVDDRVTVFNLGLGSKNSQMPFMHIPDGEGGDKVVTNETHYSRNTVLTDVKIQRFDDLQLDINAAKIRLIMIDVEGFEYEVLRGMKGTLKKCSKADVILEIFDENAKNQQTFALMREAGFDEGSKIDSENWCFRKR